MSYKFHNYKLRINKLRALPKAYFRQYFYLFNSLLMCVLTLKTDLRNSKINPVGKNEKWRDASILKKGFKIKKPSKTDGLACILGKNLPFSVFQCIGTYNI